MNIHILSLLSVATIAQVSIATAQTAPRVNILFCVADDAGHMSAYGVPWIKRSLSWKRVLRRFMVSYC